MAISITEVNLDNVAQEGLFCVKNVKAPGYSAKLKWFRERVADGLKLKILKEDDQPLGFIEYVPAEKAWRPVVAPGFLFIHCIVIYSKDKRERNLGSLLIQDCLNDAKQNRKKGVSVMSSKGSWIADKRIFIKNDFSLIEEKGRFELLEFKLDKRAPSAQLIDWERNLTRYSGWHLIYADQCPWHAKAVEELYKTSLDFDIDLKITQLKRPEDIQRSPSGYGVFGLVNNGKLLEDHYISATRFKNILKKELVS